MSESLEDKINYIELYCIMKNTEKILSTRKKFRKVLSEVSAYARFQFSTSDFYGNLFISNDSDYKLYLKSESRF